MLLRPPKRPDRLLAKARSVGIAEDRDRSCGITHMTTDVVNGCLIMVECVLLFELGIRLHHRPDTVSQHMADGYGITRIDQIMDLGREASEQMRTHN